MPKSQDPGRPKPARLPHDPAGAAPEQAEVERAIQAIVDRLKPKAGKPGRGAGGLAARPSTGRG